MSIYNIKENLPRVKFSLSTIKLFCNLILILLFAIDITDKICDNIKGKPFFISPLP